MNIKRATMDDVDAISRLFYDTVTNICTADYDEEQIVAWTSRNNAERWRSKIQDQYFFVAETLGNIIGFASLTACGYLDMMYVHKDFQKRGVTQQLLIHIEQLAAALNLKEISSDVSITAKPFFEKHGFAIVKEQLVELNGITLTNYKAVKYLE